MRVKILNKETRKGGLCYLQFLKEETILGEHSEIHVQVIMKWCYSSASAMISTKFTSTF